jgi:hypothetical protein
VTTSCADHVGHYRMTKIVEALTAITDVATGKSTSKPTGPLAPQYIAFVYVPSIALIAGTAAVKASWTPLAAVVAACLGAYQIYNNRKWELIDRTANNDADIPEQRRKRHSTQQSSKTFLSSRRPSSRTTPPSTASSSNHQAPSSASQSASTSPSPRTSMSRTQRRRKWRTRRSCGRTRPSALTGSRATSTS